MLAETAFCVNLNRFMNEKGISPRRLAEKSEVSLTGVYEARRGKTVPNVITAWKLAKGLGVSMDDLMKGATK